MSTASSRVATAQHVDSLVEGGDRATRRHPPERLCARIALCGILSDVPEATVVRMGPQGRIVVPAELRRQLGLDEGSTLNATTRGGRLILEPRSVVLDRMRKRFADVPRSTSLSRELVDDRTDEARREDER
jgi:AbrB family looped-hinge helix DNA binding protein